MTNAEVPTNGSTVSVAYLKTWLDDLTQFTEQTIDVNRAILGFQHSLNELVHSGISSPAIEETQSRFNDLCDRLGLTEIVQAQVTFVSSLSALQ